MEEDPNVKMLKEEYPDIYGGVKKMVENAKPPEPERPRIDPRESYAYYLNRDIPDWREINKDPEFLRFLDDPDPNLSGMKKLESIQLANTAMDVTTVIRHFQDFKKSKEAKAKEEARPEQAEIEKFYKEAQKGKYGPVTGEKFKAEEKRLLKPLIKPEG